MRSVADRLRPWFVIAAGALAAPIVALQLLGGFRPENMDAARALGAQTTPLTVTPLAAPARIGAFEVLGRAALASPDPRFGGLSGLTRADGALLSVSDRGAAVILTLDPPAGAAPSVTIAALRGLDGRPLRFGRGDADAEEIAALPGAAAVAFEGWHRVWIYSGAPWATPAAEPRRLPEMRLERNGGLEGLAATPEGVLWAGQERRGRLSWGAQQVWRAGPADTVFAGPRFEIENRPGWGLTALAATPRGGLIVVQRFFTPLTATRIRIGLIPDPEAARGRVRPIWLATLGPDVQVDNLEGAYADALPDGRTRLMLISDDNYQPPRQRTELWSLAFDEAAAGVRRPRASP